MNRKPGQLKERRSLEDWNVLARKKIRRILKSAKQMAPLTGRGPQAKWAVDFIFVNRAAMIQLNYSFRGKRYPTDILSFPAGVPFRETGLLGELAICLPVLKLQAKNLSQKPEKELEVLLVHGILHLLGFDHEMSLYEAKRMARWESKLLKASFSSFNRKKYLGLIDRNNSGI